MNCLLWNCRGANKPNFRRSIRYLLKKFATDVLALFETHASGGRAGQICQGIGFEHSFRVEAVGQSGGIWLLWRTSVGDVTIVDSSDQFICAQIGSGSESLTLVVVYAALTVSRRSGLWERHSQVIQTIDGPLMIGGDFNTIVRLDERTGRNGSLSPDSLAFGSWISNSSLIDIGFKGKQFTWKSGRLEHNFVAKRLDRVLCCAQTRLQWHEATVTHLPFLSSDHSPMYVQLNPKVVSNPRRRPFRFEAAWLQHPSFRDLLTASWDYQLGTPEALNKLRDKLKKWNRDVFGDVTKKKEKLMKDIEDVQAELDMSQSDELLRREVELIKEFDIVLEQEEVFGSRNRERSGWLWEIGIQSFSTCQQL